MALPAVYQQGRTQGHEQCRLSQTRRDMVIVVQLTCPAYGKGYQQCLKLGHFRNMERWNVGSIPHGGHMSYLSFMPVLHDWCTKGRDMCCLVCEVMYIKDILLLIEKSSPCRGGSGFPPYNRI